MLGRDNGIEVVGNAGDVSDGLKMALSVKPDVVLMDIRYRGEDQGIEATAAIKKELPDTKVIVFTAFPDEENLREAVKAGASGYLLKEEVQDPDTIVQAIHTVDRGNAYLTPAIAAKVLHVVKRLTQDHKYALTKREVEIVRLIAEGKDNREIAKALP